MIYIHLKYTQSTIVYKTYEEFMNLVNMFDNETKDSIYNQTSMSIFIDANTPYWNGGRRMTLDEAIRTQIRDNKEQKEYDQKEQDWLNNERC
jgi:hypothetical protein